MTQLAILEGETLGRFKLKRLIRKTKNFAKDTGKVSLKLAEKAGKPILEISNVIKNQLLGKANGIIRRNVGRLAKKYISPSKLVTTGTASLVGSLQPIIEPPIIAVIAGIPGMQPILPLLPSLITTASYKAINDLKKQALQKTHLSGEINFKKNQTIVLIGGGLLAYMLLKRKK